MAKREISSTLRNLKFMQRASLKEPKPDKDEAKPKTDESFGSTPPPARRCIVIMEGDPHPGALKGRMSFQSFNPQIEKLNEEAANSQQKQECFANSKDHNSTISDRLNGTESATRSENLSVAPDVDLKRKQPEMDTETLSPHNSQSGTTDDGEAQSSQNQRKSLHKQNKREKLDWNVLRPPKVQSRRQ
ncbi:M-phase phosphoprotein 6 [Dioscorea alata]|uniref:M-phase phosphoprotein 6 n=2 Tax=Dioscorea alata TaxID=55571 RepID=A0ACB7V480_DIOAL|nr:M-phase phosphoprotein 6 [Dioscorea alata]